MSTTCCGGEVTVGERIISSERTSFQGRWTKCWNRRETRARSSSLLRILVYDMPSRACGICFADRCAISQLPAAISGELTSLCKTMKIAGELCWQLECQLFTGRVLRNLGSFPSIQS